MQPVLAVLKGVTPEDVTSPQPVHIICFIILDS